MNTLLLGAITFRMHLCHRVVSNFYCIRLSQFPSNRIFGLAPKAIKTQEYVRVVLSNLMLTLILSDKIFENAERFVNANFTGKA